MYLTMSGPSKSDREILGKRLESHERWAEVFGWAVGGGLVIEYGKEIVDCFVNWHRPSLALVGAVLVTAGVFGEVFFSRLTVHTSRKLQERADSDIAQANERAARAEQASAEANLARVRLERQIAGRDIASDERNEIAEKLRTFAGQRIEITCSPLNHETLWFAGEVGRLLNQAGWLVEQILEPHVAMPGGIFTDGFSLMSTSDEKAVAAGRALVMELAHFSSGGTGPAATLPNPEDPRLYLVVQERYLMFRSSLEGAA
jgi:hypothetical protein